MYKIKLSPYAKIFYNEWLLDPHGYKYNLVTDQIVYGKLDFARLKDALKKYIAEHVILNSHIQDIDGNPYWVKNAKISELEYSKIPIEKADLLAYARHEFDLHTGPLYRFKLVQVKENKHRLIIILHHLVIDGSSGEKGLFTAVPNYYNDETYTIKCSIEEQIGLITKLSDTLYEKLESNRSKYKEFWHTQLSDIDYVDLKFLQLHSESNNEPITETHNLISEIRFDFDDECLAKLNQIKSKYVITPYIYSLCIFALLVHRYTGCNKFAISYVIAIKEGIDFIYGAQVNTNLISYQCLDSSTILHLFAQSRSFFKALKSGEVNYSYYPITDVLQLANKSSLILSFVQPNFKDKPFAFTGIEKAEVMDEFNIDAVDPLVFEKDLSSNKLHYRVRYDKRVIDAGLLIDFVNNYKRLFLEVLDDLLSGNENKPISDYKLLTPDQYQKIVYEFNQTDRRYPDSQTIHQLFVEQAVKTPDNIAVVYQNSKLTYQELNNKANQLAHYLQTEYNICPDDLVALCLNRSEYMLIAILAVLKAGGAYVPIDPDYPHERISYILGDTKTKVLLTDHENLEKIKAVMQERQGNFFCINDIFSQKALQKQPIVDTQSNVSNNNLAYVIYTSGTTGTPKGVMIEHKGVINLYNDLTERYALKNGEVILQFANYVFDASVEQIVLTLLNGYTLLLLSDKLWYDINQFNAYLIENHVTHIHATPSFLSQFKFTGITTLRRIISGGEELSAILLDELKSVSDHIDVINEYGPTETTITNIVNTVGSYCIGKPITNTKCYILDESLHPLPMGAIGELYIGGAGIARGYLNLPELTATKFITNPFTDGQLYKTGDLARWLPDGNLEYIGRNDSQVKINGIRIELSEIENKLLDYPEIKQAVVVIKEKTNGKNSRESSNKYLLAYYTALQELDSYRIQDFLKNRLPEYMVPSAIIYLDKLPLTTNGKLDKKALPDPDFTKKRNYVAATNDSERIICKAFSKVLGIEEIGIDDDFFSLGGNSIQAIQLIFNLQNFDLKVPDIFALRTPRKLAENTYFGTSVLKDRLEKIKTIYQHKNSEKKEMDAHLQKQIQDKRDRYLKSFENLHLDYSLHKPITNVLLTGATGYLGCNLLDQLLKSTNYNIYLLVRAKSKKAAIARINHKFQFYFDKTLDDVLERRVFVFNADLAKDYLGLLPFEYRTLSSNIDSVIHAAALVKHYGEYEKFYNANVLATVNLLNFAKNTRLKDFHYISTYSILNYGFIPECEDYIYTEDDIPANVESWQNVYVRTKLEGEHEVIKYRKQGLTTNIYRVGNLAFNLDNYRVQENIEDNAFYNWLRCLFKMRYIAEEFNQVEISPVNLTAKAIIALFNKQELSNNVYHVFNPHVFNLTAIFQDSKLAPVITLSMKQFVENIIDNLGNSLYHDLIIKFLLHRGWLDQSYTNYLISAKVLQNKTEYILKKLDFEWSPISKVIFNKFLGALKVNGVTEMTKKPKILEYLEIIAPFIPTSIYWFDINNMVLGGNDRAVHALGGQSLEYFIGKTPYDYHPKDVADNIVANINEVIKTGIPLSTEETIKDLMTGKIKYSNVVLSPLRDDDGNIIGTIGAAIDITAQKEAERLKIQLEEQAKFRKIAGQVVHDIRSPLMCLSMLAKACQDIPERARIGLREAATSINAIANNLLSYYKVDDVIETTESNKTKKVAEENKSSDTADSESIIPSLLVLSTLANKKYQYQTLPIEFTSEITPSGYFAFIKTDALHFKRMLSNLVNNSVDALDDKPGEIRIKIDANDKEVIIIIQDNGKGMPPDVIDKIINNTAITHSKKEGHGIGFTQVQETLARSRGTITIDSKLNQGTNIILTFPKINPEMWLANEIRLKPRDTVIVLDDDSSIHQAWETCFAPYAEEICLKHFRLGNETIEFINNADNKDQIVLLADYELLKQKLNGLEVIERAGIKRKILVTSHHANPEVKKAAIAANIKILPKQLASEVPIIIEMKEK